VADRSARGGILLSLAANLARAQPTAWGRIVAAVPPAAFLVAVSMIERRAARRPRPVAARDGEASAPGRPSPVRDAGDEARDEEDEAVLALARRAAAEHQGQHGQPITRDALRARLGVSNQAASELLASSVPTRASRREPPAPPDPGCLPRTGRRPWSAEGRSAAGAVRPRGTSARRAPWRGRRLDRHREGVATYRVRARRPRADRLAASTRPPGPQRNRPRERRAAGQASGAGHGQQN